MPLRDGKNEMKIGSLLLKVILALAVITSGSSCWMFARRQSAHALPKATFVSQS
jgi:hypothetical protein